MPVHVLLAAASLTVFAASDLAPALRQLIPSFEQAAHATVTLVPGSTGTLTQQIRNGAPADLFFAASAQAIDDLGREDLIQPQTRTVYARGRLVLVTPRSGAGAIRRIQELAAPRVRRIAIANPAHAPYGLAAQQALEAAGIWPGVRARLVYGENVQQALQFVQSGSADAGLVARSLVTGQDLPWNLVDPALYAPLSQTAVVLRRSTQPALAAAFLDFVKGPRGRAVLKAFGFLVPGEDF